MQLTPQQTSFIDACRTPGSFALDAVAGSGKSTTLQLAAEVIPGTGIASSFSKSTTVELSRKMPSRFPARTLHGVGKDAITNSGKYRKIDSNKVGAIAKDLCTEHDASWQLIAPISQLVAQAKNAGIVPSKDNGLTPDTPDIWETLADTFDIHFNPEVYALAHQALEKSNQISLQEGIVDFDDLLYIPLFWPHRFSRYKTIILDEAQDLSPIQHQIVSRIQLPGCRIIAAGDPYQAIYAFRGAMPNSLQILAERFNLQWMPLTVSFRCPKAVVRAAQAYVPQIESAPSAIEGAVIWHDSLDLHDLPSTVLCRNNAPLIQLALRCLVNGISAEVAGKDIGRGLISLTKRIASSKTSDTMPTSDFVSRLEKWAEHEIAKKPRRKPQIQDKLVALRAISAVHSNLGQVRKHLESLYVDPEDQSRRVAQIHLTTIHKCVVGSTLIQTPEGTFPIQSLSLHTGDVRTASGFCPYTAKFVYPPAKTLRIQTELGYELEGTLDHKIMSWNGAKWALTPLAELKPDSILRMPLHNPPTSRPALSCPAALPQKDAREKVYPVPTHYSAQYAAFLGIMVADGTLHKRGFRFAKKSESAVRLFGQLVKAIFHISPTYSSVGNTHICDVSSTYLARWLRLQDGIQPKTKHIPSFVWRSAPFIQAAFLMGLFEDSGLNVKNRTLDHIAWSQTNKQMAFDVQQLLLLHGIPSRRFESAHNNWRVDISGSFAARFQEVIGFFDPEKTAILQTTQHSPSRSIVPISWEEAALLSTYARQNARLRGYVSRSTLEAENSFPSKLDFYYVRVKSITPGFAETFCLEVPSTSTFIQNGFDAGNSKGREWPKVLFLEPHLLPSKYAEQEWELQQESNLAYVGITRAQEELHYCNLSDIGA